MHHEDVPRLILTRRALQFGAALRGNDSPICRLFIGLREAQEEIDLQPHDVSVVGELGLSTSK